METWLIILIIIGAIYLGLGLFFAPLIIVCRLGKISVTLQEMNKKMKEKSDVD